MNESICSIRVEDKFGETLFTGDSSKLIKFLSEFDGDTENLHFIGDNKTIIDFKKVSTDSSDELVLAKVKITNCRIKNINSVYQFDEVIFDDCIIEKIASFDNIQMSEITLKNCRFT